MKPLHWTVYVSCAVLTTASMSLLIASDATGARDYGRWGLAAGLAASVVGVIVVADRFARRICQCTHDEAEHRMEEIEDMVEAEGKRVVRQFHAQTEEIAEAVCSAVIGVVRQDRDATPMRRR